MSKEKKSNGSKRLKDCKTIEKMYDYVSCRGKNDKILKESFELISENLTKYVNYLSLIKSKEIRNKNKYILDRPLELTKEQKKNLKESNPRETTIQRHLFIKYHGDSKALFGSISSYEIPLFERPGKGRSSCIDLIGIKNNTLYLMELKRKATSETLLRCILETFTYYKYLDIKKLSEELKSDIKNITLSPLVYCDGVQKKDYDIYRNVFDKIMKALQNNTNNKYRNISPKFEILLYDNDYNIKKL